MLDTTRVLLRDYHRDIYVTRALTAFEARHVAERGLRVDISVTVDCRNSEQVQRVRYQTCHGDRHEDRCVAGFDRRHTAA